MNKDDINKNSKTDVILENREKPILTLYFKCSCSDYRNAMQVLQKRLSGSYMEFLKLVNIIIIFFIVMSVIILFPKFLKNENSYIAIKITIFVYVALIPYFYVYYSCIHGKQPFINIMSRISLKRMSSIYRHHTRKEIKKIVIPCEYNFYTTYFTKKTPSVEAAMHVSVDKISELPLSFESDKIAYSKLNNFCQNDDYISFCLRCFIPKNQLNEEDKIKLDIIIKKMIQS